MHTTHARVVLLSAVMMAGCVTEEGEGGRCHLLRGNSHQPIVTAWDVPTSECAGDRVMEAVDEQGRVTSLRFLGDSGEYVGEAHFPTSVDFEYHGDGVTVSYPGHDLDPIEYRFHGDELIECRVVPTPGVEGAPTGPARCLEIEDLDYSRAKIAGVAPVAWGHTPDRPRPVDARLAEMDFAARCHLFDVLNGSPRITAWDVSPDECRERYVTERVDEAGRVRVVEFMDGDAPWESSSFPASFRFTYTDEGMGAMAADAGGGSVDASASARFAARYQLRDDELERCSIVAPEGESGVESCIPVSELNAALSAATTNPPGGG